MRQRMRDLLAEGETELTTNVALIAVDRNRQR